MGVDAVVGDLPDLRFTVIEELGDRIHVLKQNGGLNTGIGEGDFGSDDILHPPVLIAELFGDLLGLEGNGHRSALAVRDEGDGCVLNPHGVIGGGTTDIAD